ncbi:arginine--tRNA ligase [Streptosporangium sp. NPDC002524]|uniref:arginine--tRNA ligase n=1 Tax=Streptosporangium sp. NPDC002524 TaxID=3154537 RepID=UPI00332A54DB
MSSLEGLLSSAVRPAFAEISGDALADPILRRSTRCDYQLNGALPLARTLSVSPREAAARVMDSVDLRDLVDLVEIAPNGFINLTVRDDVISRLLDEQLADPRLGIRTATEVKTIVVDYSHPNVAKEMHVGHLRTTIIGDSLVRMLRRLGHTVIKQNHIGDWGTPFGMLIEHLLDIGEANTAALLSVGDLNGFYRAGREKFDADPDFADRSRRRVVSLQSGDEESVSLWRVLVDQSIGYFQHVYAKLGVLLEPSDIVGESFYNDLLPGVTADLAAAGLVTESDGAMCCFPTGFVTRTGDPLPLIVRKSDGGYGYAATDLAALRDRAGRLGADEILYVVGAPQREHLAMCIATAREAGWVPDEVRTEHVAFGSVLGPDRRPFKTRAGASVRLIDLLDEAVLKAGQVVREKSPSLDPDEHESIAEAVGIGAIKYAELSIDRVKDYVFDWAHMLSFEGSTGPYLQYAHVRARSILRKAGHAGSVPISVREPAERRLALALLDYGGTVTDAIADHAPHRLCNHLFGVAESFAAFYESCPILKADEPVRGSRLALTEGTALVLKDGLGLLGIAAPDRL